MDNDDPKNITDQSAKSDSLTNADDAVKELFHNASELPPDGRAAFLQTNCTDVRLRRAVETLLKAHDEAGAFFAGPTSAAPPDDSAAGQHVGRYKLLQRIGEGGFGTVYMAEQGEPVRRKVALKIIKLGMDTKAVIARFEAERQALAMMDHPNIARVLDAGATDNGRPYFVMELVQGVRITKYCDDQQLTPRQRLALFIPVCQALQHAHQKGIIHRDVKPSNVLVTIYDGKPVPKVIDFGVAKALHQRLTEQTMFTQFGAMVGTLEYMSPEQAEMDALGMDTRSDVYSLGVLLYELLTGSTPLDPRQLRKVGYAAMLRSIREVEPPKPSTRIGQSGEELASISIHRRTEPAKLGRLVMGDLDCIVMKALEKDRSRRYETASGLADDVQRYLADEPVVARPASASYRFRKFAHKHRGLFRALTAMLILLVCATAFSTWQAVRATQARNLARTRLQAQIEAQSITREQLRLTQQAQDQAMRRLYEARIAQARASHLSRQVGQRFDSLDAIADAIKIARVLNLPQERFLELRNAAIACLALPDLHLGRQWPGWPAGAGHTDFDGALQLYARTDRLGAVTVRRVADDVETAHLPAAGIESWPLFSRDGRFLAVCRADLAVWDLRGAEPVILLQAQSPDANGIDFSPDSERCAIGRVDGSITVYGLGSKQPPQRLQSGRRGRQLAFDPSGRRLAVACDTVVEIRDADTGNVVIELPHPAKINALAWQSDGQTLAASCSDRQIYLWDVASGKQKLVLSGFANEGIVLAFSHAGGLLATNGWDGMLRLWDPRSGKQLFSTQSNNSNLIPRFSRDDRLLADDYREGKLGIWEVAFDGGEYRTLVRPQTDGDGIYECPAVGCNGNLLVVGMWDGAWLWDLKSGAALGCIKLPGCNQVLFEPSGALLTNGSAGLLRWPIQMDGSSPVNLRIGPPTQVPLSGAICNMACSQDGRVIAVSQFQGGQVLHAEQPAHPIRLAPHEDARYVAVSPDGRWVATGSHNGTAIKIWDAQSGNQVKELPGDTSRVVFSPDGAWLATTAGGLRLWTVGSWQAGPEIGGGRFAFSPDSTLIAVETGSGSIRLVDPNTGREYARLDDPIQDRVTLMSFSPDGTQLVGTNNDSRSIHIWNLRIIREELSKLGLDWNLPAYPASSPDVSRSLELHLDLGEMDAMIQARSKAENRTLGE